MSPYQARPQQPPQQQYYSPPPQQQQPQQYNSPRPQQPYAQPHYQQYPQQPPAQYHGYGTQAGPAAPQPAQPQTQQQRQQQQQQPAAGGYQQPGPAAGPGAAGAAELPRINPGRVALNSVTLLGTVRNPAGQGRNAQATIEVPYVTKPGHLAFALEAWDREATQLMQLDGTKVVLRGRLRADSTGAVKVVADNLWVVDEQLPPSPFRLGTGSARAAANGDSANEGAAREALDPVKLWKAHYETQANTINDLSNAFQRAGKTISEALLDYAFKTSSPLRWRALAREADLDVTSDISLLDFIGMVAAYREHFEVAAAPAKPDAAPPQPPVTQAGMLKVRPIREWALALDPEDPYNYAVRRYEEKHGLGKVYEALRMAVVAQATVGAWDPAVEFQAA